MKTLTHRFAALALISLVALSALGVSVVDDDAPRTEGDLVVADAWSALASSVGHALFAVDFAVRAEALGVDDADRVIAEAKGEVLAALGNVLFAYDYRAHAKEAAVVLDDDRIALR